jgi:DnaK suppressor protein
MDTNSSFEIAMKHLTTHQLEKLSAVLAERMRNLAQRVREELAASDSQHYRDLAGTVTDTSDESLARALVDVDTAIIDRHIIELRDIDAARDRIKDKTYGNCVSCSEPVAFERLLAYPTAKRCVNCQKQREHGYAHPGTPSL